MLDLLVVAVVLVVFSILISFVKACDAIVHGKHHSGQQ